MEHCGTLLFLGLALFGVGTGYPTFRERIPNGEIVPSPCNPNHVWQGVGHLAKLGGGENNQFGLDFKANGYVWTENLCRSDSDGDGLTNGEELGDPNCTWKQGDPPSTSIGLSHPGFCDPNNPTSCSGEEHLPECITDDFVCAALSDPDIVNHTLRLSESSVPAQETTYMCQVVDLPVDRDYHLVAIEPYIDNINVMHHIIVYGCTDGAEISDEMRQPNECFMNTPEGCQEMIALWAVGSNGVCYHEDAGFKVGLTGYKTALIEMHWNNPMEVSSYTDSSGMTLHLTPNLRPNEAGMLMIGQSTIVIPPGRERYIVNSSCSSECTRKRMTGDIHIIGALNHMHYLGTSATTQMVTGEGDVHVIASDPKYSYDSPKFYIFDESVTLEPGYELQLECVFKSTSRSKTTFYGEGTSDEMCFSFLMYYPKHRWEGGACVSSGTIDACEWEEPIVEGCDLAKFADITDPENVARYTAVNENCRIGLCLEECKETMREINKHPCFQGTLGYRLKKSALRSQDAETELLVMDYYYRMDSCAAELAEEKCEHDGGWNKPEVGGSQSLHLASFICIVGVALFVSFW